MEMLLSLLLTVGGWGISLAGGSVALENVLENFVMKYVPQQYRFLVVPLISLIFGLVANLQAGMAPWPAFIAALTLWAGTIGTHNNPTMTSADTSKWGPPPADALGVPELN